MNINIKKSIKTILFLFLMTLLFNACGSGSKTKDEISNKAKVDEDTLEDKESSTFSQKVLGEGGDTMISLAKFKINGINYTLIPYSKLIIDSASLSEGTILSGTILGKNIADIKINSDYINKKIKLKIFASTNTFDKTTLIKTSDEILVKNVNTQYGNISFINPNDYSVPKSNIQSNNIAPKSPIF